MQGHIISCHNYNNDKTMNSHLIIVRVYALTAVKSHIVTKFLDRNSNAMAMKPHFAFATLDHGSCVIAIVNFHTRIIFAEHAHRFV